MGYLLGNKFFGERIALVQSSDKVTEEFTGKELDEETQLNEFGARKYDAQLGVWISVDPARQFASGYLYAGNNPINMYDPDGKDAMLVITNQSQVMTGYSGGVGYSYNAYLMNVYTHTESWGAGNTYMDYRPTAQFWVGRDAWKIPVNKAVVSGFGEVNYSQGAIGANKGWLSITNNGDIASFLGIGSGGIPTSWDGLSFHGGYPMNSEGCVTLGTHFNELKGTLNDDLSAGNPISVEFQEFMPTEKP